MSCTAGHHRATEPSGPAGNRTGQRVSARSGDGARDCREWCRTIERGSAGSRAVLEALGRFPRVGVEREARGSRSIRWKNGRRSGRRRPRDHEPDRLTVTAAIEGECREKRGAERESHQVRLRKSLFVAISGMAPADSVIRPRVLPNAAVFAIAASEHPPPSSVRPSVAGVIEAHS